MTTMLDSTGEQFEGDIITVALRIENRYELYPTQVTEQPHAVIAAPPTLDPDTEAYDSWAYDHIYCFTGTGRTDGDSWYDVEVLDSSLPELVGRTFEFGY